MSISESKCEKLSLESKLKHFNCEVSKIELFQCNNCDFTTYFTVVYRKHVLERHRDAKIPNTVQNYVCKNCSYDTHFALNWFKHVVRDCSLCFNKNSLDVKGRGKNIQQWFQCQSCDYKTKWKNALRQHMLCKHLKTNENCWIQCDKCDYKTKRTIDLQRHKLHKHSRTDEIDASKIACSNLLPQKSKNLYEKTYLEFMSWCKKKQVTHYSETALLAYFTDVAEKGLKGSLWPKYSMLKATLNLKQNVDISTFNKLIMFIKRQKDGYLPKKSKVLDKEHIQKFISNAPDSIYLMTKVALIFGVAGGLRKSELLNLETDNVTDLGSKFLVTVKSPKTKTDRIFTIVNNEENSFLNLIRHYISLRPRHTYHKRFFIFYKNDRCSTQPVGINTFSKLPSRIAAFLKLQQPHLYTGHCFRRTSASILSDAGADFAANNRPGGWKSKTTAEGCTETCIENKDKTPEKRFCVNIDGSHFGSISPETKNSIIEFQDDINLNLNVHYNKTDNLAKSCVIFNNCNITNLTINIYKNE